MGKKDDITVRIRQAISPLWEMVEKYIGMVGLPWGKDPPENHGKPKSNPFHGSVKLLAAGDELVAISAQGDRAVIHEFRRTAEITDLGRIVRELLAENDITAFQMVSTSGNEEILKRWADYKKKKTA